MSQPSYADHPHAGAAPAVRGTNFIAILSLVFAFVFSPVGIVFGHLAKSRSDGPASRATAWPPPV